MKKLHMVAFVFLIIGGLNWLLVVFGLDLAAWANASWWQTILRIVYVLAGLSAVFELFTHKTNCLCCDKSQTPVA